MPTVEVMGLCSKERFSHLSQKVKGDQDGLSLNDMRISALACRRCQHAGV